MQIVYDWCHAHHGIRVRKIRILLLSRKAKFPARRGLSFNQNRPLAQCGSVEFSAEHISMARCTFPPSQLIQCVPDWRTFFSHRPIPRPTATLPRRANLRHRHGACRAPPTRPGVAIFPGGKKKPPFQRNAEAHRDKPGGSPVELMRGARKYCHAHSPATRMPDSPNSVFAARISVLRSRYGTGKYGGPCGLAGGAGSKHPRLSLTLRKNVDN